MRRRTFMGACSGLLATTCHHVAFGHFTPQSPSHDAGEDIFQAIARLSGRFDSKLYHQILGAANPFKEGDQIVGVAAADESARALARKQLELTRLSQIDGHPVLVDDLYRLMSHRLASKHPELSEMTLGQLKRFLIDQPPEKIHRIKTFLSSDVIGCVVKLMSNEELISVGSKVFNPLPNSQIGARGYLGARIQPNSPTDDLDDIRWQVFDGFAYAVGDVLLGTNPVSSDPQSVLDVERCLQDVLQTFGLQEAMPHCVLAHIDVQAEVERRQPDSTALWFQSIAGSDAANATFDISTEKMANYARSRTGRYGLYFETGQGADFTNGHSHGYDMVLHESRKYGFARELAEFVSKAKVASGLGGEAWVHVNDVAGFIGPEVFRTKEQLVRCCLEDIVMGKLHGLAIGLDVCSTLHMDVSLDDLDWCLDQVVPAGPAYLMALPTKIDPMLGYLTTGFQDHVRLRNKFGLKVNDAMWKFFQSIQVIDASGQPTEHFGDPKWVYLQYQRRKSDGRSDQEILDEGEQRLKQIRGRGVFIARGYGDNPGQLAAQLHAEIHRIYDDAKECIWKQWEDTFVQNLPGAIVLRTQSANREDYILHPASGEQLSDESLSRVRQLRAQITGRYDAVIVVSDGLNALAGMAPNQLVPLIDEIRQGLAQRSIQVAPELLVVHSGRVRAGYQIGEELFRGIDRPQTMLHIIGERPGTGHRTLSVYITRAGGADWSTPKRIDHNITRVVSGIATTALDPRVAGKECVKLAVG